MRVFIVFFVTLFGVCLSQSLHAQDNEVDVVTAPVSYFYDLLTVEVFVNDYGPYPFIIDTGSTTTILYDNIAEELAVAQNGTDMSLVHGIHAKEQKPELQPTHFRIGDMDIGVVKPVSSAAWDAENVPAGIIGTDILKSFGMIVNSRDQTITLATPDKFEALRTPSWRLVRMKSNPYDKKTVRDLFFIDVDLDGVCEVPAIFDTGSQITMMNTATAQSYFKRSRVSNGRKTWTHKGALTTEYVNKYVRILNLGLRRTQWERVEVFIKNMTSLDIINPKNRPLMIVGMDLMKNRNFAINFPKKRLYISGPNDMKSDYQGRYSMALYASE